MVRQERLRPAAAPVDTFVSGALPVPGDTVDNAFLGLARGLQNLSPTLDKFLTEQQKIDDEKDSRQGAADVEKLGKSDLFDLAVTPGPIKDEHDAATAAGVPELSTAALLSRQYHGGARYVQQANYAGVLMTTDNIGAASQDGADPTTFLTKARQEFLGAFKDQQVSNSFQQGMFPEMRKFEQQFMARVQERKLANSRANP